MVRVEPLTAERWDDFARLCQAMGVNRSCWCMYWRADRQPGEPRRASSRERARALVEESDHPIGFLAYDDDEVVGWVAVSPRSEYPRLNRGRDTAPVGEMAGVWAVPCFFVVETHRRRGVAALLLEAAVAAASTGGAKAVEGVPGDPETRARTASASYTGTVGLFASAGFSEVARRTPKGRVVVRRDLAP